jgi:hypothetical protein
MIPLPQEAGRRYLEAGEEFIGVLVFPNIDWLTIIVLEGLPKPTWSVEMGVAEC